MWASVRGGRGSQPGLGLLSPEGPGDFLDCESRLGRWQCAVVLGGEGRVVGGTPGETNKERKLEGQMKSTNLPSLWVNVWPLVRACCVLDDISVSIEDRPRECGEAGEGSLLF